ncbi:MAG: WbqC family protein [Acidobacteria bacterium]|nr:WbqC family protein [Acidobacteriota bacterium]
MRVVILQPGYLPWLGFFDQLRRADCFVIYDDVQYTRRDWRNRNRIKTKSGEIYLTVPIINRGRFHQLIKDAEIDYSQNWTYKHLTTISTSYKRAPFFENYYPALVSILSSKPKYLIDLNIQIIQTCANWLAIKTPIIFSSNLNASGSSTLRLVNICKELKADSYLTGDAASAYLDKTLFDKANIKLEYHGYKHPIYNQLYPPFLPYMSIIDLLFSQGDDSLAILSDLSNLSDEKTLESED